MTRLDTRSAVVAQLDSLLADVSTNFEWQAEWEQRVQDVSLSTYLIDVGGEFFQIISARTRLDLPRGFLEGIVFNVTNSEEETTAIRTDSYGQAWLRRADLGASGREPNLPFRVQIDQVASERFANRLRRMQQILDEDRTQTPTDAATFRLSGRAAAAAGTDSRHASVERDGNWTIEHEGSAVRIAWYGDASRLGEGATEVDCEVVTDDGTRRRVVVPLSHRKDPNRPAGFYEGALELLEDEIENATVVVELILVPADVEDSDSAFTPVKTYRLAGNFAGPSDVSGMIGYPDAVDRPGELSKALGIEEWCGLTMVEVRAPGGQPWSFVLGLAPRLNTDEQIQQPSGHFSISRTTLREKFGAGCDKVEVLRAASRLPDERCVDRSLAPLIRESIEFNESLARDVLERWLDAFGEAEGDDR